MYRIALVLTLGACLFAGNLRAFHIVGGEFELVYLGDFMYQLNIVQYFDRAQSNNPGPEPSVGVTIFRTSDNARMRSDSLFLTSQTPVEYTQMMCARGELITERVFYSTTLRLDPDRFNDPQGYYIVWERCCRNAAITNIVNPDDTGQTYILQFPPVVDENGEPFINSSPVLFPPLSDYACVNQLYYTNFAGTDPDGDSITYELVTPLNTSVLAPVPVPSPSPHPQVIWANGIDLQNIIPGEPSLAIDSLGFITVKPTNVGLHVFAVLAREFRNGIQIGEVRRDFQLLVIDGCEPNSPPEVAAELKDGSLYQEGDTVRFSYTDEKCFNFLVRDMDGKEDITLKAVGVNFDEAVTNVFSFESAFINEANDQLSAEVCVPDCPYLTGEPFIIDFIAADDACALPQMDTLRMIFEVEPPPNEPPFFDEVAHVIDSTIFEGESIVLPLEGRDVDGDSLLLQLFGAEFNPEEWGMSIEVKTSEAGEVTFDFVWDASCGRYPFGQQNEFNLMLLLDDVDQCNVEEFDTLFLNLKVELPPNNPPTVSTSAGANAISILLDEQVNFDVMAADPDGDTVLLTAIGVDFDLDDLGIDFSGSEGMGNTSSNFSWEALCEGLDLSEQDEYRVQFLVEDKDECKETNADTLEIPINLLVPPNDPPVINFEDISGQTIEAYVNEPIALNINAVDDAEDVITLELLTRVGLPDVTNFNVPSASGQGQVSTILNFTGECSQLDEDGMATFDLTFLAADQRCPEPLFDTLTLTVNLMQEMADFQNFAPPNIFTPNGDGINETFELSGILPVDDCENQFQSISIVDRYGRQVFSSIDREFRWTGDGLPTSTYYYTIRYTNTTLKGFITVMY